MAIVSRVLMGLAIVLVAGTLVFGDQQDKNCSKDVMASLEWGCLLSMVRGMPENDPPPECCVAVKKTADTRCFCSLFTKDLVELLDVNKAVHVAAFCGKPLAHGSECGGFTIP